MSELQEEGINAINLPLSPSHYELDPEDTMLGNLSRALLFLFLEYSFSFLPAVSGNTTCESMS